MEVLERSNGTLFIYNIGDKTLINQEDFPLDEIDFYKIFKSHFGEIIGRGNHHSIKRDSYLIYLYWSGKLESGIEIQFSGKEAITEIIEMGKKYGLAVMAVEKRRLVNIIFKKDERFIGWEKFINGEF